MGLRGKIIKTDCGTFWGGVILIALSVLLVMFNTDGFLNPYISVLLLTINIMTVIKVRNHLFLLIINLIITYCNYSICMANYLDKFDNYFTSFSDTKDAVLGLHLLLLFSLILFLFVPYVKEKKTIAPIICNNGDNSIIAMGLFVILILIGIYGFVRPDVKGVRGSPSTVYEYGIILFILAFYYSGKNRIYHMMFTALLFAFSLQNFIYGGRITGVQLILCWALCLFPDKLRISAVLPLAAVGFVLMSGIGALRTNFTLSFSAIGYTVANIVQKKLALDTAYSAYFTSLTFLKTLGRTPIMQRLYLFSRFFLSIFGGGRVTDSNLAAYTRKFYVHYFGGVLPFFSYFYLGILGVFFLALYVCFLHRKINGAEEHSSGLSRCLAVYITATVFRWYLYSPSQIFRGILLLIFFYGMCMGFDRLCRKETKIRFQLRR